MQASNDYGALHEILMEAYYQSAEGKGRVRHSNNLPWTDQPILTITRTVGEGFPLGQAIKKLTEGSGMKSRGELEAARAEFLGAIVYTAAAIRYIDELLRQPPEDINTLAKELV